MLRVFFVIPMSSMTLVALLQMGCSNSSPVSPASQYEHLVPQAKRDIASVRDFIELYRDARVWIGTASFVNQPQRDGLYVFAHAGIYGRYHVDLQVPITVKEDKVVKESGQPEYNVEEVTHIEIDVERDGFITDSYDIEAQHVFGVNEWQVLFNAAGDFSAIGIQLKKHSPVEGFAKLQKSH